MGAIGVFEADANADKLSAEAAASSGFELERAVDRAIFRAKERFGAYLANSQSKSDFDERWTEVKPQVIKVIAEVTTPTPGVIRRVGAALRPSARASVPTGKGRPSSAKKAIKQAAEGAPWVQDPVEREAMDRRMKVALASDQIQALQKTAWGYDQGTKLWTSKNPMQRFACPGCGTEQDSLGFTRCAGCERTWNSWPVRQAGSAKTGASTYVLMAREIKMRGDQFKMAAMGNVKTPSPDTSVTKVADAPMPQEPPAGMSQPSFGTMPGDNSGATGAPIPPEQPPTPGGDVDQDGDLAGGVTENSPMDQIQDALQDAIMALKDVQMLSVNPALTAMASTRGKRVAALRDSMDRFWGLHKQMSYVAGMLAKEASEAIRSVDPRVTGEAEFVRGYQAASKNQPLPDRTGRAWLEGYVAFHKQAESYSDGANVGGLFNPTPDDESVGVRNRGTFLGDTGVVPADEERGDAGPFDASQPASQEFASDTDQRNNAGGRDRGQGQSGSIQPTGSRRVK